MAKFSDLLDYLESIQIKPTLKKHIVPKVMELTGHTFEFVRVELDTRVSRGHLRPVADPDSPKGFTNQVRFFKDANLCWMRMICTKEVVHVFDSLEARTNTSAKFFELTENLSVAGPERPPSVIAETNAIWMALACLCPKKMRDELRPRFRNGEISAYEAALAFRIPEEYVRAALREDFDDLVEIMRKF